MIGKRPRFDLLMTKKATLKLSSSNREYFLKKGWLAVLEHLQCLELHLEYLLPERNRIS
ncbi:hypothetical protein LPH50_01520 [Xylella taiwanensis]|uniref:Uncharacterized protein n=1 Tax=Xylella taiwanensis TaxID=1444770 RepID=Z9JGD3_9GAMM|nr:hypothetical protein [Xylella taiwanensis]EWS77254.1 hypothetical protein AF72_11810 [Xylella taiwanensis]MCD8459332.1 hypothetical protein [Xylella taiwanensis]MCD8461797.1 hypothetical protein [Xylella taiwanensis]MCD8462170.1 hypothetical protein [Xylella taiwanensis]MCD8465957.1 hypothetical protein [Xylella taiwanensis]